MELSPEDSLRINVLLQNNLLAVRLDESFMTLYGLTASGEASIPLSPNTNNDIYLTIVRSELSYFALGTKGGYPLYLKRWNRMGQTDSSRLSQLLLLGEGEAVMSVANAKDISYETAQRVWWCATNTEQQPFIAKHLLNRKAVQGTKLASELIEYLFEYIPFINENAVLFDVIILLLQSNDLTEAQIQKLWSRAKSKPIYLIGFIVANPDNLPKHDLSFIKQAPNLNDNPITQLTQKVSAESGQNFLLHSKQALKKLSFEEITYPLLNAIGDYFKSVLLIDRQRDYQDFQNKMILIFNNPPEILADFIKSNPDFKDKAKAMCLLAGVSEQNAFDAILHSGAVGSQLRKRLKLMTDSILISIDILTS